MRYLTTLLILLTFAVNAKAQRPLPVIATDTADGPIYALTVWQGHLVAGGHFQHLGGQSARNLAVKIGDHWEEIGGGTDGVVRALACDSNGSLFVGGRFDSSGVIATKNISFWNAEGWHPLSSGMDDTVFALLFRSDTLYCAGAFLHSGGYQTGPIARFIRNHWDTTQSDVNSGRIYCMSFSPDVPSRIRRPSFENSLYVGGRYRIKDSIEETFSALSEATLRYRYGYMGFRNSKFVPKAMTQNRYDLVVTGDSVCVAFSDGLIEGYEVPFESMHTVHFDGSIFCLDALDDKRLILGGKSIQNSANAMFYDGVEWRSFLPTPTYTVYACTHASRVVWTAGGDSAIGLLSTSIYQDSIESTISYSTNWSPGPWSNYLRLDIIIRNDRRSTDSLRFKAYTFPWGYSVDSSIGAVAPGRSFTYSKDWVIEPQGRWFLALAVWTNSNSVDTQATASSQPLGVTRRQFADHPGAVAWWDGSILHIPRRDASGIFTLHAWDEVGRPIEEAQLNLQADYLDWKPIKIPRGPVFYQVTSLAYKWSDHFNFLSQ